MYQFVDVIDVAGFGSLPSVAMNYDGYYLENEIEGYRTLTVKGREMLSLNVETEKNGRVITDQSLPNREITVSYILEAESNELFQLLYSRLMQKLYKDKDVRVKFADQSDVVFNGRYVSTSDIPEDRNMVVGSFVIYCQEPHKKTEPLTLTGDNVAYQFSTHYPVKPDLITVTVGSVATKITVDNNDTGRKIVFNGTYAVGNVIKIDIPNNKVTKNGQNIMNNLDFTVSDFHNFLINDGDVINVTPNSTLSIELRGRML